MSTDDPTNSSAEPAPGLQPEQRFHLLGIPERVVSGLCVFGFEDDNLSRGAFNACVISGYWAELTQSMNWVELRVWKLNIQKTMVQGQQVSIHPTLIPGGTDHSGPPDYVNREGYDLDAWAGTRLASHAALWLLSNGDTSS